MYQTIDEIDLSELKMFASMENVSTRFEFTDGTWTTHYLDSLTPTEKLFETDVSQNLGSLNTLADFIGGITTIVGRGNTIEESLRECYWKVINANRDDE